jgi:hypothetical protein
MLVLIATLNITKKNQYFIIARATVYCGLQCAALWMYCECFHCEL